MKQRSGNFCAVVRTTCPEHAPAFDQIYGRLFVYFIVFLQVRGAAFVHSFHNGKLTKIINEIIPLAMERSNKKTKRTMFT